MESARLLDFRDLLVHHGNHVLTLLLPFIRYLCMMSAQSVVMSVIYPKHNKSIISVIRKTIPYASKKISHGYMKDY